MSMSRYDNLKVGRKKKNTVATINDQAITESVELRGYSFYYPCPIISRSMVADVLISQMGSIHFRLRI